jgi:hypothetical protein
MIQQAVERRERGFDVDEVHDPSGFGENWTGHVDLHAKGVPMEARALVALRHMRKAVDGLKRELLEWQVARYSRGHTWSAEVNTTLGPAFIRL